MTYYEWVSFIESLVDKTISNDIIQKINTFNFEFPQDAMIRLIGHVINVIIKKLSDKRDDLFDELDRISSPQELSLLVNQTKQIIEDVNKLLQVKYIDEISLKDLKQEIKEYSEDYTSIIKNYFKNSNTSEYAIILNNMKFMEEK